MHEQHRDDEALVRGKRMTRRQIHLRLSASDYAALQARASRAGEPLTALIRRIVRFHLDRTTVLGEKGEPVAGTADGRS